jgi:hypothetical protein
MDCVHPVEAGDGLWTAEENLTMEPDSIWLRRTVIWPNCRNKGTKRERLPENTRRTRISQLTS